MFDPNLLATLRKSKFKSRSQLAEVAGLSESALLLLETGKRAPTGNTLAALADALDVSADYLLGRVDESGNNIIVAVLRVHGADKSI